MHRGGRARPCGKGGCIIMDGMGCQLQVQIGRSSVVSGVRAKRKINIQGLLHWAFGVEHAQLDYDEISAVGGHGLPSRGAEARLIEQGLIGCVIDTSPGRSYPHDDADLVATVLRNSLRWDQAVWVAGLARAGRSPDWMRDARVRCVPVAWRGANQHGQLAATEEVERIKCRTRRGIVTRSVQICPVTYTPTASQIAAARRAYLDWWGCLLHVGSALRGHRMRRYELTSDMPAMTPWKENR